MNAIGVTLLFGLVSPLLLNVFGLLLALLFDSKIKGKVFARTAVYMPSIISPLIMGSFVDSDPVPLHRRFG